MWFLDHIKPEFTLFYLNETYKVMQKVDVKKSKVYRYFSLTKSVFSDQKWSYKLKLKFSFFVEIGVFSDKK